MDLPIGVAQNMARMLQGQSEFEWKYFQSWEGPDEEAWCNVNISVTPHDSTQSKMGEYPLFFSRGISWLAESEWFDPKTHSDWKKETDNDISLVDNRPVDTNKQHMPEWLIHFFQSLSSASCWIAKREVPGKGGALETSLTTLYHFVVPNPSTANDGLPHFEVIYQKSSGSRSLSYY